MRSLGFDEENRTMIKASIKLSIIVYSTNVLVPQSMLLWALVWIVISGYASGTPILSYKLKIFFLYGITNNYTQATDMNKKFTLARRIKSYLRTMCVLIYREYVNILKHLLMTHFLFLRSTVLRDIGNTHHMSCWFLVIHHMYCT